MSFSRLVINLDRFVPVHCDEPLRVLLGYSSDAELVASFASSSHLHNMSLMQLYELGLQGNTDPIRLLDRKGMVAGTIRQVSVNNDRSRMQLDIEPSIGARTAPTFRQLVSLRLDTNSVITKVLSGEVEPHDFVGRKFSRAIAPIGWSDRLEHVYRYRLQKQGVTRLKHATVFPDGRLYLGQWQIEKLKADFYTLEPVREEPGYRMLITLREHRAEVAMDSRLMALLPVSVETLPPGLEDYLAMVLPEDRQWVRQLLLQRDLPHDHSITYRVASQSGVVQTVRHILSNIHQGRGFSRIDSRIQTVSADAMARVSLMTIVIALNLASVSFEPAPVIHLPNFQRLGPFIIRLKALLKANGLSERIVARHGHMQNCSICGHPASAEAGLLLDLEGLRLSRSQLAKLLRSDRSMFGVGETSHWKPWFSELHAAGFHLSIGLGDNEQVTIGIFTDD